VTERRPTEEEGEDGRSRREIRRQKIRRGGKRSDDVRPRKKAKKKDPTEGEEKRSEKIRKEDQEDPKIRPRVTDRRGQIRPRVTGRRRPTATTSDRG